LLSAKEVAENVIKLLCDNNFISGSIINIKKDIKFVK